MKADTVFYLTQYTQNTIISTNLQCKTLLMNRQEGGNPLHMPNCPLEEKGKGLNERLATQRDRLTEPSRGWQPREDRMLKQKALLRPMCRSLLSKVSLPATRTASGGALGPASEGSSSG